MYSKHNKKVPPALALGLGLVGLLARLLLDTFGTDEKGLLIPFHPLGLLLVAAMAGGLILAAYSAWTIQEAEGYQKSFPGSAAGCLGHVLAGAGILLTVVLGKSRMDGTLSAAWVVLGYLSFPCLLAAGWSRLQGNQPFFLLHLIPTLFLTVHTVSHYRAWSSDPQVLGYVFSLLGIICILFYGFYQSAFDVGLEWRRKLTFFALASVTLGLASVPGSGYPWLYLGLALWALCDRPVPVTRRRRPRPKMEEQPE